jgi:SSS family transporter
MQLLDWLVLFGTLLLIVGYGTWATRRDRNIQSYLKGGNDMSWFTVGLSVMATQASAITFLSAPGLGYESGLRFVQFYFGLPIALIVVSAIFIPVYFKSGVYTAYEYLERRFDVRVRLLVAGLFLIQRGLAAGLTIFAPAIILSTILGWNLTFTNIFVGVLVIVYTVSGGSKAVSITQKWQMSVILLGMGLAGVLLYQKLAVHMPFSDMLSVAGATGRMQVLDFSFDLNERYTFWSGITGGFFLALSYFGTDQSQVQRYIAARNVTQSRMGLMFNAVLKIPMQFMILFVGVLVFVFYTYEKPPIFFNQTALEQLRSSDYQPQLKALEAQHTKLWAFQQTIRDAYLEAQKSDNLSTTIQYQKQLVALDAADRELRAEVKSLLQQQDEKVTIKDTNYVFLSFVMNYLPKGVIGLLLAVIFSAAMSSTAGELSALSSTSGIDYYKRLVNPNVSEAQLFRISRMLTLLWGALAILFAVFADMFDNLIEMVNLLGSLFYGTILGVFVVALFLKKVRSGRAVFLAALLGQAAVTLLHFGKSWFWVPEVEYLWYNVVGCLVVIGSSLALGVVWRKR